MADKKHAISIDGLQAFLNEIKKYFVRKNNLRTINGQSLIGSGDITIQSGGGNSLERFIEGDDYTKILDANGKEFFVADTSKDAVGVTRIHPASTSKGSSSSGIILENSVGSVTQFMDMQLVSDVVHLYNPQQDIEVLFEGLGVGFLLSDICTPISNISSFLDASFFTYEEVPDEELTLSLLALNIYSAMFSTGDMILSNESHTRTYVISSEGRIVLSSYPIFANGDEADLYADYTLYNNKDASCLCYVYNDFYSRFDLRIITESSYMIDYSGYYGYENASRCSVSINAALDKLAQL